MTASLIYRPATLADSPQLTQLGLAAYGQYKPQLAAEHWATMHTNLQNETRYTALLQQAKGYVCADGDTIVGMAFIVPQGNATEIFAADWAYIRMVGVAPGYEGRGIARQLTLLCLETARQAGGHTVALHTSEMMDAARHIYESMGFVQLREIAPIFGKRYWVYTLQLT